MRKITIIFVLIMLLASNAAFAKISNKALHTKQLLSEEMLLIIQLDIIGLHSESREASFVSYLDDDKKIHVDMALFERAAARARTQNVEEIAKPYVQSFMKVLETRMKYYTPTIAKDFDSNTDIIFDIYVGKNKAKSLYGGSLKVAEEKKVEEKKETVPEDKGEKGIVGTRIKNVTGNN